MLDIGKFLTPDDRGKESAGIAGGIVGSLAGQSLLVEQVEVITQKE